MKNSDSTKKLDWLKIASVALTAAVTVLTTLSEMKNKK